jgi:PAS domain S-box-containing protein
MPPLDLATRHAVVFSPDPLLICAVPGTEVLLASLSAGQLLGRDADQLIGRALGDCLGVDPPLQEVGGPTASVQACWLVRPGQPRLAVEVSLQPVPDAQVLVRVQPRSRLALHRLVEHVPVALRGHDPQGAVLFANPAAGALPPGPLPAGDLAHADRVWQVEHFALDDLAINAATDISARERQAQKDRERLAELLLLVNTTDEFVGLNDIDGRRLFVSPSFYRATGYTPEEVLGTDFRQRIHPHDLPLVEQSREANLHGERTRLEYRCVCKDGSHLWLDLRATPIPGPDGRIARIVWASRDISDRKRLEQEFRDCRRFIEHVADTVADMLSVYDLVENRHVWVNAQSRVVCGYTPGELLRMGPGEFLQRVHPDDLLSTEEVARRLLASPQGGVVQVRYRIQHPQRGWRVLLTRCLIHRFTPEGQPWQVLGASADVTDQPTAG